MSLSPAVWADLISATSSPLAWSQPVLNYAKRGGRALEIGAGTASTSRRLAEMGVLAHINDFSPDIAQRYGGKSFVFDVREPWPDEVSDYDIIHSAGLLEHYGDEEIIRILRHCAARGRYQIHMVPNARCRGYVEWKERLEREGSWPYGEEYPKATLAPHYEAAGLTVTREYSVGNEFSDPDGERYLLVTEGK